MEWQEVEDLVRNDYARLKKIAMEIDALAAGADAYRAKIAENMGERDFFTPEEDDEIRKRFTSYLAYRTALLRMFATYAGFKTVPDPDLQTRCFMVGDGAAVTVFENSLKLVNTFANDPQARRKLNEPEPRWGIPGQMFEDLYRGVTSQRNHDLCEDMAACFDVHREKWRYAEIWPAEEFDWLANRRGDHPIFRYIIGTYGAGRRAR